MVKLPACDVTRTPQVTEDGGMMGRARAPRPRRTAEPPRGRGGRRVPSPHCGPRLLLAALAGAAMTIVAAGGLAHGDLATNLGDTTAAAAYATLGALIVRRAGNVIGWIMLGEGAASAFLALASITR